ncbi:DUF2384 domain-containing protein [Pseudomonas sp. IPO3774]|nr:DUF2384 domain-containing protein [Pseudomonas sp. IPO3774]
MISSSKSLQQPGVKILQSIWILALGLPSRSARLHDLILEGLSFELLDRIGSLQQVQRGGTTEWMSLPVRGLTSKHPLDVSRTGVETRAVVDLIGRLEEGCSRVRFDRRLVGLRS